MRLENSNWAWQSQNIVHFYYSQSVLCQTSKLIQSDKEMITPTCEVRFALVEFVAISGKFNIYAGVMDGD